MTQSCLDNRNVSNLVRMPIFRRSPMVGIETPTSTGDFNMVMTSSVSPPLMSGFNRCVIRQCRELLVRQLDVHHLLVALQGTTSGSSQGEFFRFVSEEIWQTSGCGGSLSTSPAADLLDRMEQTGDDATFEMFMMGLRQSQRHLAAVLDETRSQLRKWWSHGVNLDDEEEDEEDNDEKDRSCREVKAGKDQLTGEQVRQALRRLLRSTTRDVTLMHSSSSSCDSVSDDSRMMSDTDGNKDKRRTRLQELHDVMSATRPYIDCLSIVRHSDHASRKWTRRQRESGTTDTEIANASNREKPPSASVNSTWTGMLVRNQDFRRIPVKELPSTVAPPPGLYRWVYVAIDAASDASLSSTSTSAIVSHSAPPDRNGYSYTARRSASLGVGDTIRCTRNGSDGMSNGVSTTFRNFKPKHKTGNASPSYERKGNSRRNDDRKVVESDESDVKSSKVNPPPIPSKPKRVSMSVTKAKQQMSIGRQQQEAEFKPSAQTQKEIVPPPLPARVNLLNLRQGALPPPPPPPPPRKTDSPLSVRMPLPPTPSSHGLAPANVQCPTPQVDVTIKPNLVGIFSSITATSSFSSDSEAHSGGGEADNDVVDLDFNVSACSSLTNLSCAIDGDCPEVDHVTTAITDVKQYRSFEAVEDDNYEPITPLDSARCGATILRESEVAVGSSHTSTSQPTPAETDRSTFDVNVEVRNISTSTIRTHAEAGPHTVRLNGSDRPEQTTTESENNDTPEVTSSTTEKDGGKQFVSTLSYTCSNFAIAEFMQQPLEQDQRTPLDTTPGSPFDCDERDGGSGTHEDGLRTPLDRYDNDAESIVYEDIDQYQMTAELDHENEDDTTSAAYLDPATSSSLSGRLRLLRAEHAQRRRLSAARMSDANKGWSLRSSNGYFPRSAMDPELAHLRRNSSGIVQLSQAQQVITDSHVTMPPTHRALTRTSLLVVVENNQVSVHPPKDTVKESFPAGGYFAADEKTGRKQSPLMNRRHVDGINTSAILLPSQRADGINTSAILLPSQRADGCQLDNEYEIATVDKRDMSYSLRFSSQPTLTSSIEPVSSTANEVKTIRNSARSNATDARRILISEPHVFAFDREGFVYYVPHSELRRHGDPTGETWFYPIPLTTHQAALFLSAERQDGCFVVYRPAAGCSGYLPPYRSPGGLVSTDSDGVIQYIISVGRSDGQVLHYPIVGNGGRCPTSSSLSVRGDRPRRSFLTIGELVDYFRRNRGRLATRLRRPLREARWPPMIADRKSFEIRRDDIQLSGDSRGRDEEFGMVCIGTYKNGDETLQVTVKIIHKSSSADFPGGGSSCTTAAATDDDFVDEVRLLSSLRHVNITRLVGVSLTRRPFYLVTELPSPSLGRLNDFLFQRRELHRSRVGFGCQDAGNARTNNSPSTDVDIDVDAYDAICRQAAEALGYLEHKRYVVHRNVSAMSFEVNATSGLSNTSGRARGFRGTNADESTSSSSIGVCSNVLIKLTDFSRARSVKDNEYVGDPTEKIFVKWAAPEVLTDMRYSTLSDVYALAVVFWEVYSDGVLPYGCLSPEQTAVYVSNGGRLDRPTRCPAKLFKLMLRCWSRTRRSRPSAAEVVEQLRAGVGRRRHRGAGTSTVLDTHAQHTKNPPLPPIGPQLSRVRLPHLKTSYSFTASALTTPSISDLPSAPTNQSFTNTFNNKNNSKTSSSPPLPRSRDTSQRNASGTSNSKALSQSRTSTPPRRRKWDYSLIEPSSAPIEVQSPVGSFAQSHATGSQQSSSAMQLNFLAVPGGRRNDGSGSIRTSSKSSLSSRESMTGDTEAGIGGTATDRDSERSSWTSVGGSLTLRPRNMDDKKKSTRQSIRSLFTLAISKDASS